MIITAFNPDISTYERTSLTIPSTAAGSTLTVKNTDRFSNTNRILIGSMGREKSEIVSVSGSPTATVITTGAQIYPHSVDDQVYNMRFDQIKFYRSTTGIAGAYSLLTTVPMDVDNADQATYYDDAAGLATYYYKTSYYNSVTTIESLLSDPIPGAGYDPFSAGSIIDQVMREVGDQDGTTAVREEYYAWLNEVNYDLQKRMKKPYDFLKRDLAVNVTAGQPVAYPADALHIDSVEYSYSLGGYVNVYNPDVVYYDEWIALTGQPTFQIANDRIEKIYFDDTNKVVQTFPKFANNQVGTWLWHYWKTFTYISSDGNIVETIDPKIYKMYLKAQYFRKKAAREERFMAVSDRWVSDYNIELAQVVKYNRKNIGKTQSFRMENRPSLRSYRGYRYR